MTQNKISMMRPAFKMEKYFALIFSIWFLLLATDAVYVVSGLFLKPSEPAMDTADFPCAGHQCGCKSALDCRNHCCCFPQAAHKKTCGQAEHIIPADKAPIPDGVSYWAAAKCRGNDQNKKTLGYQSFVFASPENVSYVPFLNSFPHWCYFPETIRSINFDPPEKVPIV